MISINNLGVEFNARPLFSDASLVINPKERIALVGKNGAGKSTLLKIIAGQQSPTSGEVAVGKSVTIGYLPQVMKIADECTVREEAEKAFGDIKSLAARIAQEEQLLGERSDVESDDYMLLVERFSHDSERFELMGGFHYHALLERTLLGLGFERTDFDRPTKEFSGGWRMRIELAKLLMQRPDVLLLDEPTNHLDIESIAWLEQFLLHSPGAVVLVSHDRAFLNNVTQRTVEISCGKLFDYRVKYDDYVELRAERREQQERAYENQQREIEDIKSFVEQFRYKPTKAAQVQSRLKRLEKMVPIEIDDIETERLHLKFPACSRTGDYPLICEDVEKHYGSHQVFEHVDLILERGEKVAFVGRNGEGKSTLVKCIMDEITYGGKLKVGHNVKIGYYAQNEAQLLDDHLTVFETIDREARGEVRLKINDILGAFMFGGEKSEKQVKVLSGGERSRLAMIRLLLKEVNFLILDEPTNHLDMRTKDILKEAVRNFEGTVIVVSHDRDFLDGLVSKVFEFSHGKVIEHLGGIYEFLRHKDLESMDAFERENTSDRTALEEKTEPTEGKLDYERQKQEARERRKREKEREVLERRIAELETVQGEIEREMSTPEGAADMALAQRYGEVSKELELLMEEWMDA